MRVLAPLLIVCLLAVGLASSGQDRTLSGSVVDPAGRPVSGATIELRQGGRILRATVSNTAGAWKFEGVAPGNYNVRVAGAGFETTEVSMAVGVADPPSLRVILRVGVLSEAVTVTEATPLAGGRASSGVAGGVIGGMVGGTPSTAAPRQQPAEAGKRGTPAYPPSQARILPEWPMPDTASYARIDENRFRRVIEHPLSTFSVDVDTASYANVRRFLNEGRLPPADAVRIEEMINYFHFDYPAPRGDVPLSISTELAACPWNPRHKLALVGLRAAPIRGNRTPPRNLTFLLDVSGSMQPVNRLPLIKTAMRMLVDTLRPEDKVAVVVYAGASGLALPPTSGGRRDVIRRAIAELNAGGSTNGAAGIQLAYDIASENFVKGGVNRVILATDGDFNVGVTSQAELMRLIEERRDRGVFLSVLGVGDNNLQDSTMEMLADKGNGNYSYLDSIQEARRVLIAEAGSTLVTVAKDVKLQVEFNPRFVGAYRLVGYENRALRKEDFNNDRKDAGEMGAGHMVTALYEIVAPGDPLPGGDVDPLKYQPPPLAAPPLGQSSTEIMTVKVRYKTPGGDTSRLIEIPIRDAEPRMSSNLGFAAAIAELGMLLRRSDFRGSSSWEQAMMLAKTHRGTDPDGYRAELIRLMDLASALDVMGSKIESQRRSPQRPGMR